MVDERNIDGNILRRTELLEETRSGATLFETIVTSLIHSLVFSLIGRAGRNQSPVM